MSHFLFLGNVIKKAKKRNIHVVAFLHDLEILRFSKMSINYKMKIRLNIEEVSVLRCLDLIVAHNKKMKTWIEKKIRISDSKIKVLEIFDYLLKEEIQFSEGDRLDDDSIIIAGNLSMEKSGYIYKLPLNLKVNLYGPNYNGMSSGQCKYIGTFDSDELPHIMKGRFGLIWDGESINKCDGVTGEYLKYNNPHKTSLYVVCGIPVVVWRQAAIADFVCKNKVGFVVDSLEELVNKIRIISEDEYKMMRNNAIEMSQRLSEGLYTRKVLDEIERCYM